MDGQRTPSAEPEIKLRSTCDRCTTLKVRCNKQKPKCKRCRDGGVDCVYGPYRWRGRPSTNASNTAREVDDGPSPATRVKAPFMTPQVHGALGMLDSVGDHYLIANHPTNEDSAMSATMWDSSPTQAENSINHMFFNFSNPLVSDLDFLGDISKHEHPGSMPFLSARGPPDSVQGSSPNAPTTPTTETHHCVQTLLRILQGLHTAPMGSLRGPESDGILKANSAALQGMEQMLSQSASCDACMANSNLDFLLYTASARMLSWYRAVYTCLQPSATPETVSPTESVYFRPVQLSDFNLDTSSERRINSMLLLFELQKLARFLVRLSDERFWGRDGRQESPGASPSGGSSVFRLEQNVLEAFDEFLTASVQELILCVENAAKAE